MGPNICCGVFGCYFGTIESSICEKENDSTQPCGVRGEPCGSRGQGNCVADGLCCDSRKYDFNSFSTDRSCKYRLPPPPTPSLTVTSKKFERHIAFGSFVCPSVRSLCFPCEQDILIIIWAWALRLLGLLGLGSRSPD